LVFINVIENSIMANDATMLLNLPVVLIEDEEFEKII
jgi:hypothetical protein